MRLDLSKARKKIERYQRWRRARARIVKINQEILFNLDKMEKSITVNPPVKRK